MQGDEPDRSELMKLIYKDIFEWYDDKVHSGDTLITYRTAIFENIMENHIVSYPEISNARFLIL